MFTDEKKHGEAIANPTDPFDWSAFKRWLAKKPVAGEYFYAHTRICLLCQFFEAQGYREVACTGLFMLLDGVEHGLPGGIESDWFRVAYDAPHTFGAALERAAAK